MKRRLLTTIAAFAVSGALLVPAIGHAGKLQDLDNELKAIQKKTADAQKKQQEAERAAASLKSQKEQETKNLDQVRQDIQEQGAKLDGLNKQVLDVTEDLNKTTTELGEAEDRVAERDKMLKSRVRLMYMNGSVSYFDVIFSATNFSDFLDRFYALQNVVGQDKTILEANKADRDLVAAKKKQVEAQLNQVKALYVEAEVIKQKLQSQEKQKQVMIASITKQEKEAEDLSDDQEQMVVDLASRRAKILEEQRKEQAKQAQKPAAAPQYSGGKLLWPVPSGGTISSPFGYRVDPIKKVQKLHAGVDIASPRGTTIVAAEDGDVLVAGWTSGYGNTVVLDHGNGLWTWYGHIREDGIMVKEGDHVKRGQKIAEVGSTGDSTGNHVHFEVRLNKVATDPMPYLK